MRDESTTLDPDIVRTAIAWLLRVQNDAALQPACEAWQCEHADHARAWRRVAALDAELTADVQNLSPGGTQAAYALDQTVKHLRQRRQVLKLFSLVVAVVVVGWFVRDQAPEQGWFADYATTIGERRRVVLDDGSLLALNTNSAVDVRFDARQRLILLRRGEILITSGADVNTPTRRPLRVQTQDGIFEAVGTRFLVRLQDDVTTLAVQEGQLRVRPAGSPDFQRLVGPGEAVRVTHDAIRVADLRDIAPSAWNDGVLDVRDMRLDAFLAEVARYRHGRLTCDPTVAVLRVSGVFQLDDPDRLLTILPRTLPVALEQRAGNDIHVTPTAAPAAKGVAPP